MTDSCLQVYKAKADREPAVQLFNATVGDGALLVFAPDPVVPFADAIYHQRQTLSLSPEASAVVVESVNSGRATRGERWQFDEYSTETTFSVASIATQELAAATATMSPTDVWFTDRTVLDSRGRGDTNWGFDMGGTPRDAFATVSHTSHGTPLLHFAMTCPTSFGCTYCTLPSIHCVANGWLNPPPPPPSAYRVCRSIRSPRSVHGQRQSQNVSAALPTRYLPGVAPGQRPPRTGLAVMMPSATCRMRRNCPS